MQRLEVSGRVRPTVVVVRRQRFNLVRRCHGPHDVFRVCKMTSLETGEGFC